MGNIFAIIDVADVASVGVYRRSVPKYFAEEINFPGLQNDVVGIVHHRNFLCVTQVIFYGPQADSGDELVLGYIWIVRFIKGIEKLEVVIGKT